MKFESLTHVRNYLHSNEVSSRDFLVRKSFVMDGEEYSWDVVIVNMDSIDKIKELLNNTNSKYTIQTKAN